MSDVLKVLMTVLDQEHAEAVVAHRRTTIKKPLTAYAAKLLAKRLAEWPDANEAADIMIEKCWQGFNRTWVRDRAIAVVNGPAPQPRSMAGFASTLFGGDHGRDRNDH